MRGKIYWLNEESVEVWSLFFYRGGSEVYGYDVGRGRIKVVWCMLLGMRWLNVFCAVDAVLDGDSPAPKVSGSCHTW